MNPQNLTLMRLQNNINGSVQGNQIVGDHIEVKRQNLMIFANNTNLQIYNNTDSDIRLQEFHLEYQINELVDGMVQEQSGINPLYYRTDLSRLDVIELAFELTGLNGSYALYLEDDLRGSSLFIDQIWNKAAQITHPLLFQSTEAGKYNYTLQVTDIQDNLFVFAIQIDASQLRIDSTDTVGESTSTLGGDNTSDKRLKLKWNVVTGLGIVMVITGATVLRHLYIFGRRGYAAELRRGIAVLRWRWTKFRGFK